MLGLTHWVSSSRRDGLCADQGHRVTGAQDGDHGEKDSSGRGGLGRPCLCLTHLNPPSIPTSLQLKGWCPAASGGLPRLPWSCHQLLDPVAAPCPLRPAHSCLLHHESQWGLWAWRMQKRGSYPQWMSHELWPHPYMTLAGSIEPWNRPSCH